MTPPALDARLAALAAAGQTTHYGALARDLGWPMAALTAALEQTMGEDLANGRPLRAAVVTSRLTPGLPAAGFWDFLAERGVVVDSRTQWTVRQRELLRIESG